MRKHLPIPTPCIGTTLKRLTSESRFSATRRTGPFSKDRVQGANQLTGRLGAIIRSMDLIESSKQSAVSCMEYFLRNFSHVPDDKLEWTPTQTAKSAMRIAAHTALYAGRFAKMIRDRRLPVTGNLAEWLRRTRRRGSSDHHSRRGGASFPRGHC